MSLVFVLVEPTRSANVGAAARAIKTMGFEQLILVNSSLHLEKEAHWLAHGATDILERTLVVDSVADIRSQYDQLIATTARVRSTPRRYLTPNELKDTLLQQSGAVNKIALLFGRESSGLSNNELELCDLFSYVPLINNYPSLNLAQSVMVYSYAMSEVINHLTSNPIDAQEGQLLALKHKTHTLLQQLDIKDDIKLCRWLLDGISLLSDRDCKMAHQLLNDIGRKLNANKGHG
ncbi:MAG: tRNA/rRNA methyltransferase [Shewanella sp.]